MALDYTQWRIYDKVSRLANDADRKVLEHTPCTPEWFKGVGYAKALRDLAIQLLDGEFVEPSVKLELVTSNDSRNS